MIRLLAVSLFVLLGCVLCDVGPHLRTLQDPGGLLHDVARLPGERREGGGEVLPVLAK